jgi:hypothetical protein
LIDLDAPEGASFSTIKQQLHTTAPTIILWKTRFLELGVDGLDTHHPGQSASVLIDADAVLLDSRQVTDTRASSGSTSRLTWQKLGPTFIPVFQKLVQNNGGVAGSTDVSMSSQLPSLTVRRNMSGLVVEWP